MLSFACFESNSLPWNRTFLSTNMLEHWVLGNPALTLWHVCSKWVRSTRDDRHGQPQLCKKYSHEGCVKIWTLMHRHKEKNGTSRKQFPWAMEAGVAWEPVNAVSNAGGGGAENMQLETRGRPGHVALPRYITRNYAIAKHSSWQRCRCCWGWGTNRNSPN